MILKTVSLGLITRTSNVRSKKHDTIDLNETRLHNHACTCVTVAILNMKLTGTLVNPVIVDCPDQNRDIGSVDSSKRFVRPEIQGSSFGIAVVKRTER